MDKRKKHERRRRPSKRGRKLGSEWREKRLGFNGRIYCRQRIRLSEYSGEN